MSTAEIIGFADPRSHISKEVSFARFDLIDALQRVRRAEIARITEVAEQLCCQFGIAIAAGFLHFEILGRPPRNADWTRHVEELQRNKLTVPAIVEELLAMAASKGACSPAEACSADRDKPAG
jgi:hypothetical protein